MTDSTHTDPRAVAEPVAWIHKDAAILRQGKTFHPSFEADFIPVYASAPSAAVPTERERALEEAAKVCDETAALQSEMATGEMEQYRKARAWDASVCAAKIRALLAKQPAGEEKP